MLNPFQNPHILDDEEMKSTFGLDRTSFNNFVVTYVEPEFPNNKPENTCLTIAAVFLFQDEERPRFHHHWQPQQTPPHHRGRVGCASDGQRIAVLSHSDAAEVPVKIEYISKTLEHCLKIAINIFILVGVQKES